VRVEALRERDANRYARDRDRILRRSRSDAELGDRIGGADDERDLPAVRAHVDEAHSKERQIHGQRRSRDERARDPSFFRGDLVAERRVSKRRRHFGRRILRCARLGPVKALVKVGYGCNNHCTFCHTLDVRDTDGTTEEVERKIDRAARLGHTMVCLSGGEVTMRKELLRWAARIAARDMDVGLITNGRMLAYAELVEKLLKHRLRYVYLSLHGGTARVHNSLVRADAFEQTFAAIENLAGRGLDFTVNTVITRQNVDHLRGVVDALLRFPDIVIKFSMVQPKGGGEKLFEHIMPRVSEVAAKVKDAIEYGLAKSGGNGPRFAHDGIPFCLVPGHEERYDDLKTHRFATMVEIGEPDFFPVDDRDKVQPDECDACALRGPCPGLYRGYREVHGDGEVRAVSDRPRSNSFHFVREASAGSIAGGRCPVRDGGVTPWDRGRILFLRDGDRIDRYRTESRDFTDREIESAKHDLGQVYLDVSQKIAPDDFAHDLAKLRRSAICDGCPHHDACAGIFEREPGDPFTRDDERVRAIVADLRGDVIDVGCGEGRYDDVLVRLGEARSIRYVGVEPDAARADALRARWPWATVRASSAESIDDRDAFDHALVLRSWNHLRDPRAALAAIARALRAGGTLTVADNVAFGLVRTRAQAERAERSGAALEHYRNDGADAADRTISPFGFERIDRHDISPATSNQWILRYRKTG
jgi:MoaA/NifB/PqqE/SkfB family radical SAM enzyme